MTTGEAIPAVDVTWACVDAGFYVASRRGDFLGYVDQQSDGGYGAFDMRSQPVGVYDALEDAMATVNELSATEGHA